MHTCLLLMITEINHTVILIHRLMAVHNGKRMIIVLVNRNSKGNRHWLLCSMAMIEEAILLSRRTGIR